jgi:hyperosmotically inducible protein
MPDRDAVATAGQEISQKTAEAAKTAQEALSDGALTAKIKAKMALDDRVKALDLNVDTANRVVTVGGKVRTSAERERALALARETDGVKQVVDRLVIDAPR